MSTQSPGPVVPGASAPHPPGGEAGERSSPGLALQRMASVFYAPVSTFRDLGRRYGWPDWLVPLAVGLVLTVVLAALVSSQVDVVTPIRERLEEQGLSEEEIQQAVELQTGLFEGPMGSVILAVQGLSYPIILALLALIFWGGASAFGASIEFGRTLAVVAYAYLVRFVEGILLLFVLQGREPVRFDRISSVLATNPASYLPASEAGGVTYALLSSLNPFTLWMLALVALGLSAAGRLSRGAAFGVVGGLFVVWLAVVAGWAAVFG